MGARPCRHPENERADALARAAIMRAPAAAKLSRELAEISAPDDDVAGVVAGHFSSERLYRRIRHLAGAVAQGVETRVSCPRAARRRHG